VDKLQLFLKEASSEIKIKSLITNILLTAYEELKPKERDKNE